MSKQQVTKAANQAIIEICELVGKRPPKDRKYAVLALEKFGKAYAKQHIEPEHILSGLNNVMENSIYRDGQKAIKKRLLTNL